MIARACASFCFARTCAGMTGAGASSALFFSQWRQAQYTSAAVAKPARTHNTQAQPLGISTGGLMSRKAFVADPERVEAALVRDVLIIPGNHVANRAGLTLAASAFHGFQRTGPARRRMADRCGVESRRCRPSGKGAPTRSGLWPAVRQRRSAC